MGPTNVALYKLYEAETNLREAERRLEAVTKNVRLQHRKVDDLTSRQQTNSADLMKQQAKNGELELEIKSRDAKIEHLREQQSQAQTNREYQAFLVEINTLKVDKAKIEEESLKLMEAIEKLQKEGESLVTQLATEKAKLAELQGSIDARVKEMTADVDALRPARDAAAAAVPEKARLIFERLAERYEGEAMEPIDKPHPKREEYIAMICNIDLTVDVYNRLHSRDELLFCPSCGRIMHIPADLVPEKAVHKPKEKKPRKPKLSDLAAPVPLQTLAGSVVRSVDKDEDEEEPVVSIPAPAESVADSTEAPPVPESIDSPEPRSDSVETPAEEPSNANNG
jgi:predicted  nucleic acid-binding Zn-ribbon protein